MSTIGTPVAGARAANAVPDDAEQFRSLNGDTTLDSKRALDRFLAGVERRAFVMARTATRSPEDAMDLVQEAMLKLVRHYGDRDESEWAPLFHQILQRAIYDWYRRTRVRNRWRHWFSAEDEESGNALENQPDPLDLSPERANQNDRAMVALESAIAKLPLRQQQAFLLRAWEGMDVEQTARAMKCSAGSVKTHYFRALQALREQLKDYWP
jgi:RNA polymerase sigma-70 factor, ECF subfamily